MPSLRTFVPPLAALTLVAVAAIPWHPEPGTTKKSVAAAGLDFERHQLPGSEGSQRMRPVAPDLEVIQPWISAVGASVGTVDLRRQGHAGDACLTDPRDDSVKVFPVPGSTGEPFATFTLDPTGLRYDTTMAPIGCVPTDLNSDSYPDFLVYYWGRSPVLFLNQGTNPGSPSTTDFEAHELVAPMQVWNTTALNVADVDGDGILDVMVGNYFPDGARVLDPTADNDERMQMQHSMGNAKNAGTNRLYLGESTDEAGELPAFTDASERIPSESAKSWTLAIGYQDLTDNGLPDAYIANDFGPDQLLINTSTPGDVRLEVVKGRRDLTTPKSKVLGHDSFKGMGIAFSYEAYEELPRMLVSNITSPWALQESNLAFYPTGEGADLLKGDVPFEDRSTEIGFAHSGWSWDLKPIDLLNTGSDDLVQATGFLRGKRDIWPRLQETAMGNDLILHSPKAWLRIEPGDDLSGHEENRLWRPVGEKFVEVGDQVPFTDLEVSRGIAPADVDGDGRRDFLVANQWGDSYVYLNRGDAGDYVSIRIVRGDTDNPVSVIGAQVVLRSGDYFRETQVFPANGHSGVGDDIAHFGLPNHVATDDLSAEVSWTDTAGRHTRTFPVTTGDQTLEVN